MTDPVYGVTPQGFILKPVAAIIQDFEDEQTSTMDAALDTSAAGPVGQLNGIYGAALGELWELGQAGYNGFNPDDVEGVAQDNVGAVRGSKRLTAKPSSVFCNCTLTAANSPYLAATLVANVAGNAPLQFSNALDVVVTVNGVVPVLFKALAVGPTAAASGTLTVITAPVTGWSVVTNPLDATLGQLIETDPDYRLRQELEIAAVGACTVPSETADLLEVANVISAKVLENTGDTLDTSTGMPGHSTQSIVWDGPLALAANQDIGLAVWNGKPSGAQTFGNTSVQIVDSLGAPQTVFFSRPSQLPVYMAFTVTLGQGVVLATIAPQIKAAIVNLSNGFDPSGVALASTTPGILAPGGSVIAMAFRKAAFDFPGVTDVSNLALDFTASPTATANLPVTFVQVGTLDTSRITVNGI